MHHRPTGWGGPPVPAPDLAQIQAATARLTGVAVRTPLLPLQGYDARNGILLKPEVLQPVGSYKLRGVFNWAAGLTLQERARGLSTHSAGNTALALGHVGRLFGVPTRSLLPDRTPQVKLEALRRCGVTPILLPLADLLDYVFQAGWRSEPFSFLNPWADPRMIAGNGTVGLEILADLPDVDSVYVPVGGGGLIAGIASALKAIKPSVRVIGVQPAACPALLASFEAGKPVWVDATPTICDTAVPVIVDEMYPLLRQVVDDVVTASETAIRTAVGKLAARNRLMVEGSGALSVAAATGTPAHERGRTVCIVSGGTIDLDELATILAQLER